MRNEPNLRIEQYRDQNGPLGPSKPGTNWGTFNISRPSGLLRIISSGTDFNHNWEHISVSLSDRCPTWEEMCFVKNLFWNEEETVVQFHPKKSKYVNNFPHVLHMWKRIGIEYELPPDECV